MPDGRSNFGCLARREGAGAGGWMEGEQAMFKRKEDEEDGEEEEEEEEEGSLTSNE